MAENLELAIKVTYSDAGLDALKQAFESLKNVMSDLNSVAPNMSGNRTVYGQMASDVKALGNAAASAAPKLKTFQTELKKFDHKAVTAGLNHITDVSNSTSASADKLITAQRKLNATLNQSTIAYRASASAASASTREMEAQAKLENAMAAQTRAQTGVEAQALKAEQFAYKQTQDAAKEALRLQKEAAKQAKDVVQSQQEVATAAQRVGNYFKTAYQGAINIVKILAALIQNTLGSAIRSTTTALSTFGSSASAKFATLKSQLDATGKSFLQLAKNSATAGSSFHQLWSGDALIRTGRNLMNFVHQGTQLVRTTYAAFSDLEQSISRSAVAGIDMSGATVSQGINMDEMWDFVYKVQRGQVGTMGTPIRSLTTNELSDAIYYLTSAVGASVTPQNQDAIADMVAPMAIWASATQTDVETYIKGVLGIGQQFGFDPRDFTNPSTSQAFSGIAGVVGYLSNASSMEPTDVISGMNMVGPSAYLAYGGKEAQDKDPNVGIRAMYDTMLAMFAASEVGVRGSSVGRSYQRLFSSLTDATPKTRRLLAEAFGFENSADAYKEWLYNDQGIMDFNGNGEGILGLANLLQKYQAENGSSATTQLINALFTENATRGMAATLAGMDSSKFGELQDALNANDFEMAANLLSEIVNQETALISNAVTNMQNAWGQFANTIFNSSKDQIIGGLDTVANIFRELADIVQGFPNLGKLLAGSFSFLTVGGGITAALLMLTGTMVGLSKAFKYLGVSVGVVTKGLVTLPLTLLRLTPVFLLTAAAIVALKTAWDSNFLGMRDTITSLMNTLRTADLSTLLYEWMGSSTGDGIITWISRVSTAFQELISGVFFNVGPTNNLGALIYKIFDNVSGDSIYQGLNKIRSALSGMRTSMKEAISSFVEGANAGSKFVDLWQAAIGVMDVVLTGKMGSRGTAAGDRIGEWLGIDGFQEKFQAFAQTQREGFIQVIQSVMAFGSAMGQVFGDIGDNLSQIFTLDNAFAGLKALLAFASGFAIGIATAFLSAAKSVQLLTAMLANLGVVGRAVSASVKDITGLTMTLKGVAKTLGILVGLFAGGKLLAPIMGFSKILNSVGVVAASLVLKVASFAVGIMSLVAGFGVLGGAVIAVLAVLASVFAALVAYTAVTQGVDAALTGMKETWTALKDTLAGFGSRIADTLKYFGNLALEVAGISEGLISFSSIGEAVGNILGWIAEAALVVVGSLAVLVAALYRVGAEAFGLLNSNGGSLFETFQRIVSIVTALGAALVGPVLLGFIGITKAVVDLVSSFATAAFEGQFLTVITLGLAGAVLGLISPFGGAVLAVAAMVAGIITLANNFDKVRNVFGSLGKEIIASVAALATVWVVVTNPIAGVILAIAAVGVAYLAITGDAESMASSLAGIVSMLPEPWQAAANKIVEAFAKAFDFIRNAPKDLQGSISALFGTEWNFSGDPQDSYYLQYKYDQGTLTPQDVMNYMNGSTYSGQGYSQYDLENARVEGANKTAEMLYGRGVSTKSTQFVYSGLSDYYDKFGVVLSSPEAFYGAYGPYMSDGERKLGPSNYQTVVQDFTKTNAEQEAIQANYQQYSVNPNGTSTVAYQGDDGLWYTKRTKTPVYQTIGGGYDFSKMPSATTTGETGSNSVGESSSRKLSAMDVVNSMFGTELTSVNDLQKYLSGSSATKSLSPAFSAKKNYLPQEAIDYLEELKSYNDAISADPLYAQNMFNEHGIVISPPIVDEQTVEDWEAYADRLKDIAEKSKEAQEYMLSMTDMYAAVGNSFDWKMGNGSAGGSGASFLNSVWDQVSSAVGESEWFNQIEMLADGAILGVLDDNMYGVNTHEAMRPLWERIAKENGIAVEELIAEIPKWVAPDAVVSSAATEVFSKLNNSFDQATKEQLDVFGKAEGWTDFGLDWADLIDYSASMAMAGKDWDFTDYMRDSLGMSEDQIQQAIDNYDIDFSAIGSDWTEGTTALALSMSKGINVLTEEQYDIAQALLASADEVTGVLELTAEQIANLDPGTAAYLQSQGITIVMVEPTVQWSPADVISAGETLRKAIIDTFRQGLQPDKPVEVQPPIVTALPNAGGRDPGAPSQNSGGSDPGAPSQNSGGDGDGWSAWNNRNNTPTADPPPIRTRRKQTVIVDQEVTEVEGNVTYVHKMDVKNQLRNAFSSAIEAAGGVKRTTRTETIYVDVQLQFGEGSGNVTDLANTAAAQFATDFVTGLNANLSGVSWGALLANNVAIADAGLGAGAQFTASFLESVNTNLPAALSAVISANVFGEEGSGVSIPVTLSTDILQGQLIGLQVQLVLFAAIPYTVSFLGNNQNLMASLDDVKRSISEVPSVVSVILIAFDFVSSVLANINASLDRLNGKTATVYVRQIGTGGTTEAFATGGFTRQNMTLVGEEGPEFVRLPWGSRVFNNMNTMSMLSQMNRQPVQARSVTSSAIEATKSLISAPTYDRGGYSESSADQRPLLVSFGDVTINNDQDIEEVTDKVAESLGKKMGFVYRGQVSNDPRVYND